MRRSVWFYIIMALALLAMIRAPFMPYVHSELLAAYLGYDSLTAAGLVEQMYILHTMPESVSIFGYAHYGLITMLFMILGVIMIFLPIILEAVSLILLWRGRTEKQHKRGIILSAVTIFLFVAYLFVFSIAGSFFGVATKAGYGIYVALAASIIFTAAASLKKKYE